MRYFILIILVGFFVKSYGQDYPINTKYIETISAKTYSKNEIIQSNQRINYYDSNWVLIDGPNNKSGQHWVTVNDSGQEKIKALLKGEDTITIMGEKYDSLDRLYFNYQMNKKDTISKQLRFYNKIGKDSILFSWREGSIQQLNRMNHENFPIDPSELEYNLSAKWKYDVDGNLIKSCFYNFDGDSTVTFFEKNNNVTNQYEIVNGEKTLVESSIEITKYKKKTIFYKEKGGYNYGITLGFKKDGYSIKEYNDVGKLISFETFFKSGTLINSVKINYSIIE